MFNTTPRVRKLPIPLWVFFFTFALRFLALSRLAASPYFLPTFGDMKFYSDWALRIMHGQFTTGQAFYGLPGYAYFLALIYSLVGFDPFTIGVLQGAAEGLTATLLYLIALELFAPARKEAELLGHASTSEEKHSFKAQSEAVTSQEDRSKAMVIGAIAALGWAFFQPAQTFSIVLMPTSWLILAFWGCIYWMLRTRVGSIWNPWIGMGLAIGAMSMMIATILFLLPLVFWSIATTVSGVGRKCTAMGVTIACVFIGLSPCWIHNRFIAHEPVLLSAHSGLNFYIGNNETSNGYPKMPPGMRADQENMLADSITLAEKAEGRKLKHVEVSEYWSKKANLYIHEHFKDWLGLMGVKLRNFWNAYQYDDLGLITHFSQDGIILPGLRFGFVAALGIAGMGLALFKYPRARWVMAAVLLHMSALMSVFITERYRLAAAPGLCVLAALFVVELWETLLTKRWVPALGTALLSIACGGLTSLPQTDRGFWWLDYYNTGVQETDAGELDKSQRNLEMAFAYVPTSADINFALGNLWLAKNNIPEAKHFYQLTLRIDPHYAKAWNNAGILAMAEKRWDVADKFLAHCLAETPSDAKAHFLAARTKMELGDIAGAQTEIRTALQLKPDDKNFQAFENDLSKKR